MHQRGATIRVNRMIRAPSHLSSKQDEDTLRPQKRMNQDFAFCELLAIQVTNVDGCNGCLSSTDVGKVAKKYKGLGVD
jgi:hypothetical protein